jgi:hypothetical protein
VTTFHVASVHSILLVSAMAVLLSAGGVVVVRVVDPLGDEGESAAEEREVVVVLGGGKKVGVLLLELGGEIIDVAPLRIWCGGHVWGCSFGRWLSRVGVTRARAFPKARARTARRLCIEQSVIAAANAVTSAGLCTGARCHLPYRHCCVADSRDGDHAYSSRTLAGSPGSIRQVASLVLMPVHVSRGAWMPRDLA